MNKNEKLTQNCSKFRGDAAKRVFMYQLSCDKESYQAQRRHSIYQLVIELKIVLVTLFDQLMALTKQK